MNTVKLLLISKCIWDLTGVITIYNAWIAWSGLEIDVHLKGVSP